MPTTSKVKRGRPRRASRASEERLVARCSPAELAEAEKGAAVSGVKLSNFVREAVAVHAAAVQVGRDWRAQLDLDKALRGTAVARRIVKARREPT